MKSSDRSIKTSLFVTYFVAAVLALITLSFPWILKAYFSAFRGIDLPKKVFWALIISFYVSVPFAYLALYQLRKMLLRIRNNNPFCMENVKSLRLISYACLVVAVVCLVGCFQYAPLIFITIAAGFIGVILKAVKNVMEKAVEMREENDLTV